MKQKSHAVTARVTRMTFGMFQVLSMESLREETQDGVTVLEYLRYT